jgi:hypothetical protein
MMNWDQFKTGVEDFLLIAAGVGAVLVGLTRVYKWTRTLDDILDHSKQNKLDNESLTDRLRAHVDQEEARDKIRDVQLIEITGDLREITREIRPNGGSSMKDTINHIASEMGDVKERLASVEQWKRDSE